MSSSTNVHSVTKIKPVINHFETGGKHAFTTMNLEVFGKVWIKGVLHENVEIATLELFFDTQEEFHEAVEPLCHMLVGRLMPNMSKRIDTKALLTEHI